MVDADAGGRCEAGIGVRFAVTSANRVEQLDARLGSGRTDALEVTAAFAFVDSAVVVWVLARNAGDATAYFVTLAAGRLTGGGAVTGVARPLPVGAASDTLNARRPVVESGSCDRIATRLDVITLIGDWNQHDATR